MLAQQFSESMMYPLNKFLQADLEGTFITVGVRPTVCVDGWVNVSEWVGGLRVFALEVQCVCHVGEWVSG